jgi:hypothetical protein
LAINCDDADVVALVGKHLMETAKPYTLGMSAVGQNAKYSLRADVFRSTPKTGHRSMQSACPFRAMSGLEPNPWNER